MTLLIINVAHLSGDAVQVNEAASAKIYHAEKRLEVGGDRCVFAVKPVSSGLLLNIWRL